jgi:hypothetical protein
MIAPDIQIPAGLEEAFAGVISLLGGNNPNTIISAKPSPARKNFRIVGDRSLFRTWQNLYKTFPQPQKDLWRDYWITLPFGTHAGNNGYPGSGYSAFIYINAPRYHLGLPPLLTPP